MNGLEEQLADKLDVVRLDLLSPLGRQAAQTYGVRIVPLVLLFDGRGKIIVRQAGLPDAGRLLAGYQTIQAQA